MFHKYCIVIIILFISRSGSANQPPNFIIILGDDIGWNDFGFHGSSQIPTPNIDALGYNGVVLNRLYTEPTCTPSRAALLTGKYPIRYGYQSTPLRAGEDRHLPLDHQMLPEKLKQLNYNTHLVGKWHLGASNAEYTPIQRGFDSFFGYWSGYIGYFDYFISQPVQNTNLTFNGLDLHEGLNPEWQYQGQYATDLFTKKSLEIIDNHDISQPLFLYLSHLAAHAGGDGVELGVINITEVNEKYWYIEEPRRRRYAEVVNKLDQSVGEVVDKLQAKGMLNNSVILFLSDNGAQTVGQYENHGSNYPLKGLKWTLLEGGVRGSAVLYSPLLTKQGYINNQLMHISDIFPTFMKLAGGNLTEDLDGVDQWESISKDDCSNREEILLNIDEINGLSGILTNGGRYKFLNGTIFNGSYDGALGDPGRSPQTPHYNTESVLSSKVNQAIVKLPGPKLTTETIETIRSQLDINGCKGKTRINDLPCFGECLFDIFEDPCETTNIVKTRPEIRDRLHKKLLKYLSEIVPARNMPTSLDSNPANCNNTWFPWLDLDGCVTGKHLTDNSI